MDEQETARRRLTRFASSVLKHARDDDRRAIYQTSTIAALLEGIYEGDVTVEALLTHGDFGVGTFNQLDGEMVIVDGVCYHLRADGTARVADRKERTPFAVVTFFRPQTTVRVDTPLTRSDLEDLVDSQVTSANLIHALRVTGRFTQVRTRTVTKQHEPYPPLTEAAKDQLEAEFDDIEGTLAGYVTPAYEQGISVAGYHLHFIDDSRTRGGHCLDFTLAHGSIDIETSSDLHLSLPASGPFLTAHLSREDLGAQIRRAEGR